MLFALNALYTLFSLNPLTFRDKFPLAFLERNTSLKYYKLSERNLMTYVTEPTKRYYTWRKKIKTTNEIFKSRRKIEKTKTENLREKDRNKLRTQNPSVFLITDHKGQALMDLKIEVDNFPEHRCTPACSQAHRENTMTWKRRAGCQAK